MSHLDSQVIAQLTTEICAQYKIAEVEATKTVAEALQKDQKLTTLINASTELKQIERTALYKYFSKKLKKQIYFDLRKYRPSDTAATPQEAHISTRERLGSINQINSFISKHLQPGANILDLGGGVFPLTLNFDKIQTLTWIDKDPFSFESLKKSDNPKLILFNELFGQNSWKQYLPTGLEQFDMALMFKVIPVVKRQNKEALSFLLETPAKLIFITASKEALAKKQNIQHREDKVLREFIKNSGREIVDVYDADNEFGYLIR